MKGLYNMKYQWVHSFFGRLALIWHETAAGPCIVRVLLPKMVQTESDILSRYPGVEAGQQPEVDALGALMTRFLSGEVVQLPTDLLDATRCAPFQWRVLMADYAIPRGQVRTYQQIAAEVGSPRGSRAVGSALAHNPFPVIIPCHRVVRADGSLGGYAGGVEMKRMLLGIEGWAFDKRGRLQPSAGFDKLGKSV